MAEDNKIKIKYTAHDIAETQLKDFSKNKLGRLGKGATYGQKNTDRGR